MMISRADDSLYGAHANALSMNCRK